MPHFSPKRGFETARNRYIKFLSSKPASLQVFLVCTTLSFGLAIIGNTLLFHDAKRALTKEVRSQLEAIAVTAALKIDGETLSNMPPTVRIPDDILAKAKADLTAIRQANPDIAHVCLLRKTHRDNTWLYVAESQRESDNEARSGVPYYTDSTSRLNEALYGPTTDEQPKEDGGGYRLSGYAPVREPSGGMVVGVLVIDLPVNSLYEDIGLLRRSAAKNALLILALSLVLSLIVTRLLSSPLHRISQAANSVRDGDLEATLELHGSKELCTFADTFNSMVAGLKESRDLLLEQTSRDLLTGLHNHMYFQEQVELEIERARRFDRQFSILFIDLDRFKVINDTLGHTVGNSMLRQLAAVLKEHTRNMDTVARYGGDEFALILPETDLRAAIDLAERLRSAVEETSFQVVPIDQFIAEGSTADDSRCVPLSVTIGVAEFPAHHHTREGLIMAADIALCRAKHLMRNSVYSYDPKIAGDHGPDPYDVYQALHDPSTATMRSLAAAVDAKDKYTKGHSDRVASYAIEIGRALDLDTAIVDALHVAGLLHDLGKIGVADVILNKQGALNTEEREAIRQHPSVGSNILKRAPSLDAIIPGVHFHHERWDGNGYPEGLSGEQISLMARILAVADAYDAMTTKRPYRKSMTPQDALVELMANAGTQFDPQIVDAFVNAVLKEEEMPAVA